MNKKQCNALLPLVQLLPAVAAAAAGTARAAMSRAAVMVRVRVLVMVISSLCFSKTGGGAGDLLCLGFACNMRQREVLLQQKNKNPTLWRNTQKT